MKYLISVVTAAFFLTNGALAQADERQKQYNVSDDHVAIQGYDPVAYFTGHKAKEGSKTIKADYQGVTYYFASEEDKKLFSANPGKYEPEYGGWCAYAMGAKGEKVEVDPETFKIVNGKLYLFYNKFFNNTLKSWNKDEPNLKKKADINWSSIYKTSK
jgi:YHS domain-containing protein